jgi:murein DD-endopeptidase MepM/ murein hydrolase activator NlpD
MKKALYLLTFTSFFALIIFTAISVNKKLITNEKAISEHFLELNTEEFLSQAEEEYDETYEKNTDLRQLQNTQNLITMLKALNVSALDIESIGKILDIDKLVVEKKSYVKMLYQDDINDEEFSADILPPYIEDDQFVRDIKYLSFPIKDHRYILTKKEGIFSLQKNKIQITHKPVYAKGKIEGSLYDAFITQNIPHEAFQTFVNIYSFDIDFQRDIREGDTFEIVYDTLVNDENAIEGLGRVLYVKLSMKKTKKDLEYFILRRTSDVKSYYDRKGKAASKTFMKTPVNGARISSKYGYRKHPILGYSKLHTGTDFAAPSGTAIYAAADGVITFMGWNGGPRTGYGRYTIIRHNNTYSTAYAHQSRFNTKLRQGSRVKQGHVIGYVGSTGYSTGAHLHYEVIKNGKKINPATITSFSRDIVSGRDKPTLLANIRMIDELIKNQGR